MNLWKKKYWLLIRKNASGVERVRWSAHSSITMDVRKPDPGSEILKITVDSYKRLFGQDPQVLAIHAGLECGLVGAIYPGMDMVSFGPTIKGAHSPDERLEIKSAVKFWELLVDVLNQVS